MKAIIVDDEPKAIELLQGYMAHFNTIRIIASFRNSLKAFEFITTHDVDVVFLDINMPHLSGLSLSRMIKQDIKIIFTTAYSEYAAESYEIEATDYLLKPISFERFGKAIAKLIASEKKITKPSETLFIKSGTRVYTVAISDIIYLEKGGNYMTYHCTNSKILARESIAEALSHLPENFTQIHKSYIVNTHHVKFIEKDELCINRTVLPIGASFKETVMKIFR